MTHKTNEQIIEENDVKAECQKTLRSSSQISTGATIGFIVSISIVYFLLLGPGHTILSLKPFVFWIEEKLQNSERALMISLLPEYISALVFGVGILGGFFGHYLQKIIVRFHVKIQS